MRRTALFVFLTAVVFLVGGSLAQAGPKAPESYGQARKIAESKGLPLLLKFESEWCSMCAAFQKAYQTEDSFRAAVASDVVFFRIDAEKGEGVDIAKSFGVTGYPTFILANASGEIIDSWMGYKDTEKFLVAKAEALEDPTTITEKMLRFRENPTEDDARRLGDLRQVFGYPAEAVAYYQRAESLNPHAETDYDLRILGAMARGADSQLYTPIQIRNQVDLIFASAPEPKKMLHAYGTLSKVAHKAHAPEITYPYLRATYEALRDTDDEYLAKSAAWMRADYVLHIERDVDKAVRARKDSMPENWQEDGRALNQVAWWCFENRVNLEEAEQLARRGVELAPSGSDKANVLDTLAEICNLNNDCSHAVQYIRLAIEEDPRNEYFQHQLGRFEEILARNEAR